MGKLSSFEFNKDEKVSEKDLKEKFDQYSGMNKQQLNQQLFEEVARQKKEGKFDFAALSGMVENLKGMVSQQDYENIKRILESLK